jgi:hypothetical protein
MPTHLSSSSGMLRHLVHGGTIIVIMLKPSRRPCPLFEGDPVHEGDDNGCESSTGTWVIHLPCQVVWL